MWRRIRACHTAKHEAEKRAHNHSQEFERIVQEYADLWAQLQDALEIAERGGYMHVI